MTQDFPYFLIPLRVGIFVQWLKIIIDFVIEKTIKLHYLRRSWWFPSVHGALIWSLCTMTSLVSGFQSIDFAICMGIGILIWYDAVNLRQEAWKHAQVLNEMRKQLGELRIDLGEITHIKKNFNLLKERLGHTLRELLWWILIWILITLVTLYTFGPSELFTPIITSFP